MSINIKQADGLKRLSQTIEFYKSSSSISIPQLFTGSYNDLTDKPIVDGTATIESIETEQASFYVQDGSGNTIALIDNQGVHSIDFYANGESVKQHMSSSADQLNDLSGSLDTHKANSTIHITAEEREKWNDPLSDEGDTLYINDAFGNTIAIFDANGLTTTNVTIKFNGEALEISSKLTEIDNSLTSIQNKNNDQDSRLDGLETATEKLEFIDASELDTTLSIIDTHGNPIAQFDESGLTTTEVTIADSKGSPMQVGAKIENVEGRVSTAEGEIDTLQDQLQILENNFSSHTDDTTAHITASERETWNTVTSKANQTDLNTTNQNLATEVTNRQNADQTLQDNIDIEAQTRANEDAAINERTAEIEASENGVLSITDPSGNAIAQFDKNGLLVTEIQTAGNVTVGGNFNSKELAADKVFSRGDIEAQGEVKGATVVATGNISAADVKTSAIDSLNSTISTINNNASALEGRVSTAEGEIDTLQGQVSTLIASDSGKSVRKIANEELAAALIPSDAQESLNTLQEIADWIQDHPEDAAAMNSKIEANTTAINNLSGRTTVVETKTQNIQDDEESETLTIVDQYDQPGLQVDASGTTVSSLKAESVNAPTITTGSISDVGAAISELQTDVDGLEDDLATLNNNITSNPLHTHKNKTLLDTYDQTNANIKDAVDKKHEHSNKDVLDKTTASFTTEYKGQLDSITTTYATKDELNTHKNNAETTYRKISDSYTKTEVDGKIPTVNNAKLTIQKNGVDVTTFTANSASDATANITVPTKVTDLSDANNYALASSLNDYRLISDSYSRTETEEKINAAVKDLPTQNTTYTFADGTNGTFTVTPSGGTAQTVSVGAANYTLPPATSTALGGVKIGANISVAADGTISTHDAYVLPNTVLHTTDVVSDITNGTEDDYPADKPVSAKQAKKLDDKIKAIGDIAAGSGNGDMLKAIYDPDNDGKVTSAESADEAQYAETADWSDYADKAGRIQTTDVTTNSSGQIIVEKTTVTSGVSTTKTREVEGTTGDAGFAVDVGVTAYQVSGSVLLPTTATNVTISPGLISNYMPNTVSFNASTGMATYTLYLNQPNKLVQATISYTVPSTVSYSPIFIISEDGTDSTHTLVTYNEEIDEQDSELAVINNNQVKKAGLTIQSLITDSDITNYYTKTEINNNYYTKTNINNNHYTKDEVDAIIEELPIGEIPSDCATTAYVDEEVLELHRTITNTHYTKSEIDAKLEDLPESGSDISNGGTVNGNLVVTGDLAIDGELQLSGSELAITDTNNNAIATFDKDGLTVTKINVQSDTDNFVKNFTFDSNNFYERDNNRAIIRTINLDASAEGSWECFYEYFRQNIFQMNVNNTESCVGYFTRQTKDFGLPTKLSTYFLAIQEPIDSFKIELLGALEAAAECSMIVTVYTQDASIYQLQICTTEASYTTQGWTRTLNTALDKTEIATPEFNVYLGAPANVKQDENPKLTYPSLNFSPESFVLTYPSTSISPIRISNEGEINLTGSVSVNNQPVVLGTSDITNIQVISQSEYNALATKSSTTLYIIMV